MIIVKDLHKKFDNNHVLRGVNYHVHQGEKIVIIGPSGSGKSTFLRCLNLLETPTSGEIWFDGQLITSDKVNINHVRQHMGMVFQNFNLFNNLSIMDNITLAPVKLKLQSREEASENALKLLERVGLKEKADSFPSQLSGGQKQKFLLARAVYKDAPVLILDEPTAALDPIAESEIYDEYAKLSKDKTAIFISHRLASTRFSDRILLIGNQGILEEGTHEELLQKNGVYAEMFEVQKSYYEKERLGKEAFA